MVALEPKTHTDVQRVMGKLGQVLAVPDAQRVWRHIDAAVEAAAQSVPPAARGMRVYFEVNRGPYGAGASSFIGETLTRLGARNILPASLGPFPKLNPEFVVQAQPQFVMSSERADLPESGVATRVSFRYPGWNDMPAVREGRVCLFTRAQADVLVRPGPRLGEAARIVADCVQSRAKLLSTPKP